MSIRKLTQDQLAALTWFFEHLCFENYSGTVPPHLGKDIVTERAYEIRDAISALQDSLPTVSPGDWMYRQRS